MTFFQGVMITIISLGIQGMTCFLVSQGKILCLAAVVMIL